MGGEIRILDVGCGAGLFFDALQHFGHVEGIESDSTMVSAAGKWRNRIRCDGLDEGYAPSAPFDVILMLDVLEHVIDPDVVLRRATRILSPTGRILINMPSRCCGPRTTTSTTISGGTLPPGCGVQSGHRDWNRSKPAICSSRW